MIETDQNKLKAIDDTLWELIRNWLFYRLFPKDITDLSEDKYTKGFGDGYKMGRKHLAEQHETETNQLLPS